MEMTWLETIDLLGLDLLALMILVLAALDRVDHAMHHAWLDTRSRFGAAGPFLAQPGARQGLVPMAFQPRH